MSMIEVNRNPSKRELLWFGIIFLAFWMLVSGVLAWRFNQDVAARWIIGVAVVVTILYSAVPQIRRPIYLGWMYAAYPIGWVVSHVLLAIVYYLVFTPVGFALRIFKGDPMRRHFDPDAESYWDVRDNSKIEPKRYFRQF